MKVKLLQPWNHQEAGRLLDTQPGVAEVLVRRKIAKVVKRGSRLATDASK